jgi:hypothetical protein
MTTTLMALTRCLTNRLMRLVDTNKAVTMATGAGIANIATAMAARADDIDPHGDQENPEHEFRRQAQCNLEIYMAEIIASRGGGAAPSFHKVAPERILSRETQQELDMDMAEAMARRAGGIDPHASMNMTAEVQPNVNSRVAEAADEILKPPQVENFAYLRQRYLSMAKSL